MTRVQQDTCDAVLAIRQLRQPQQRRPRVNSQRELIVNVDCEQAFGWDRKVRNRNNQCTLPFSCDRLTRSRVQDPHLAVVSVPELLRGCKGRQWGFLTQGSPINASASDSAGELCNTVLCRITATRHHCNFMVHCCCGFPDPSLRLIHPQCSRARLVQSARSPLRLLFPLLFLLSLH